MKRFIDLGEQICEDIHEFAFFCTVTDTFEGPDEKEAFCCWYDFEEDWRASGRPLHEADRYRNLLAPWVKDKCDGCRRP